MTKPNDNPLGWVDRLQALIDAHPDAEAEIVGGLAATTGSGNVFADLGLPDAEMLKMRTSAELRHDRIALPVSELTDDEIELIRKATVPPEEDYDYKDDAS